jgi:DNA helicase-2/ATP-dependent DNA helicase PcrA
LTYDDFIPLAITFLERNERILKDYNASLAHLIVDEYQDVNYGQQRLVELLAGKKADVMVVGDDDQTIYEWRNARPNYIIREFEMVFDNKPLKKYKLSYSFRFGPVIAQCAYNTIKFNTNRFEKPLIAHHISKEANIILYEQSPGQSTTTNKQMAEEIVTLKKYKKVLPKKIIVLGRMFAQLHDLQAEFMLRGIPFRVEGQRPFYERREIIVLLNYIRSAINYGKPVSDTSKEIFLDIANTPNRRLSKLDLARLMNNAIAKKRTLRDAIRLWIEDPLNSLNDLQQEQVLSLMSTLERASKRIVQCPSDSTHLLLGDLVEMLDYLSHYDNYYGKGETSYEKKESVLNFLDYALQKKLPPEEFLEHIAGLDTTRGEPEDQQIVMTTVYRVKGLEYDYVFIPNCNECYMPCLYESVNRVYDKSGEISEPEPSETIENERRLFYVAITRAREAVFIGAGSSRSFQKEGNDAVKMSRFIDEMQYEATEKVMTAFQQVANGKGKSVETLLKHTAEFGGIKSLIIDLTNYLSRLGNNSLLKKIVQITSTKPEAPFGYRTAYSKIIVPEKQESQNPSLHSAWDDVD